MLARMVMGARWARAAWPIALRSRGLVIRRSMALIHGSRGLIYFAHQFKPTFNEAALLADPELLPAVTAINAEIRELAPALNSPSISNNVQVTAVPLLVSGVSAGDDVPPQPRLAAMTKRLHGTVYLFTVNMGNRAIRGSFKLKDPTARPEVAVLGEHRSIGIADGVFTDEFKPYEVHLYTADSRR